MTPKKSCVSGKRGRARTWSVDLFANGGATKVKRHRIGPFFAPTAFPPAAEQKLNLRGCGEIAGKPAQQGERSGGCRLGLTLVLPANYTK